MGSRRVETHPYAGRRAALATKHGKEQQIARPFASAQLPIVLPAPMDGTRAIDRFETNLDRTASGPPAGSSPNRVVLPANFFERLNTGMSVAESIGKNVPKMGTESSRLTL